jgi:redox-sensitive bicupin YhaK (pirin superfamily)
MRRIRWNYWHDILVWRLACLNLSSMRDRPTLGGGFNVARILPFRKRRMVGPFIFLDHAGSVSLPPDQIRKANVRPFHIGL